MKNVLLLFAVILAMSIIGNAQVISNFNNQVTGIAGFEKAGDSGPGLDSLYWTKDPSNSGNGVMALAFKWDSASWHGRMELGTSGNATYIPGGTAQYITFWVYIDSAQKVPDSTGIDTYAMDNTNWSWTEGAAEKHYVKDIPKNVWYPLSFPLAQEHAKNPNFAYNAAGAGKGFMTGLQFFPTNKNSVGWKGVIYVDNVALVGSLPHTVAGPGMQGFEKAGDSGPGLDSIYAASDPLNAGTNVMAMKIHWDSTSWHARMELGSNGNATYVPGGAAQYITFWVYIDSAQKVPDSLKIDNYAMDNSNWSWTEDSARCTHFVKDIPHNVWYPLAFPLAAEKASNPNFAYNAQGAGKGFMTGLQLFPNSKSSVGWKGVIYVKDVALLDTITASKPSVWTAADFESKGSNGLQGFYVPAWAGGTLKRFADLTTTTSYVLQGALKIAPSAKIFAVVRDTVPMMDAVTDSGAISISFQLYLPPSFPNNAMVNFYVSGGAGDSVAVIDTVGVSVKHGQWNTLTINGLDVLTSSGKFNPKKPATVGVKIWYPAPYDTTTFSGNIEFDNLQITGFSIPRQLIDGIKKYNNSTVKTYQLYNNYPNPFNPSTKIRYDIPKVSKVVLKVFDVLGREIATLVNEQQTAGTYEIQLNMDKYASGIYFVEMVAGGYQHVQKMMLLK